MNLETFKKGIFNLPFRRFGSLSQIMIKKLYGFSPSKNNFHDLYNEETSQRIEVKFSTVRSSWAEPLDEYNVLDCIAKCQENDRIVPYEKWNNYQFDCNMNQVKPAEFEMLYYGLFFEDAILIFKIKSEDIGPKIHYSDKQHKGNVGEGQFHIGNKNLPLHIENYLCQKIDYRKLYNTFSQHWLHTNPAIGYRVGPPSILEVFNAA